MKKIDCIVSQFYIIDKEILLKVYSQKWTSGSTECQKDSEETDDDWFKWKVV